MDNRITLDREKKTWKESYLIQTCTRLLDLIQ